MAFPRFDLRRAVVYGIVLVALCAESSTRAADADTRPATAPARATPPSSSPRFADLPRATVTVDLSKDEGPLELWRNAIGHGGVNSHPLPDRVVDGLHKLRPRLVRVFIQEFFDVYPEHGRYDWSRLDPYMDALDRTGAKVVAAITIKPRPLYPKIDPAVWRPNDVKEWQQVIAAMVKRYSVERQIITYWEIGNETDIGENGGCPYLIPDAEQYAEFYRMTIEPILATFRGARVGGPAVANAGGDLLPKFIERCRADHLRLDFISWHLYSDDPDRHAALVEKYRKLLEPFGDTRPEMLVTEWNKGFDPVSVEEMAFDPRRAAAAAACMLAMTDARVDWSFYYHAWDQTCYLDEFRPFFRDPNIMYHHWNEVPHRFGLFGVAGEARPQYFVYQLLTRMRGDRVPAMSDEKDLRTLASRSGEDSTVLLVNYGRPRSQDRLATIRWTGLAPGRRMLTVFRIDQRRAWSDETLELKPAERREVDVREAFTMQAFCPADSVSLVTLVKR
jgi:xylan 1,4-beta-xylosidase